MATLPVIYTTSYCQLFFAFATFHLNVHVANIIEITLSLKCTCRLYNMDMFLNTHMYIQSECINVECNNILLVHVHASLCLLTI